MWRAGRGGGKEWREHGGAEGRFAGKGGMPYLERTSVLQRFHSHRRKHNSLTEVQHSYVASFEKKKSGLNISSARTIETLFTVEPGSKLLPNFLPYVNNCLSSS